MLTQFVNNKSKKEKKKKKLKETESGDFSSKQFRTSFIFISAFCTINDQSVAINLISELKMLWHFY